jgi:hypothetical protein
MADGLIPKPPSLSAAGSRSKRVRSGTNGPACYTTLRRDFAADLLQMQRQSIADATIVAVGGSPGRRLGAYRPGRPASHVFPEAEPEPILAAPPGRSHGRMTARAPARSQECIDGDFKLMHYPSGRGFVSRSAGCSIGA